MLNEIHPALHRIPVPLDDLRIAVLQPRCVRNDHSRVPPTRSADYALAPPGSSGRSFTLERKHVGRNIGERALRRLRILYVVHPLMREALNIEVVGSSTPEDAGIAHPAQPLVALRTVSRDAQEISPLPPKANRIHLVHHLAGRQ